MNGDAHQGIDTGQSQKISEAVRLALLVTSCKILEGRVSKTVVGSGREACRESWVDRVLVPHVATL